jgi:hypothetical protein
MPQVCPQPYRGYLQIDITVLSIKSGFGDVIFEANRYCKRVGISDHGYVSWMLGLGWGISLRRGGRILSKPGQA